MAEMREELDRALRRERAVPPCPKCGKPLGLYYMDCLWCYGYADEYTHADYAHTAQSYRSNHESGD